MLTAVCSIGKTPGSTSVALGLAAAWERRGADPIVVELDPAGGDLAAWWNLRYDPGVAELVADLAASEGADSGDSISRYVQEGPGGRRVLMLPSALEGDGCARLVSDLGARWGLALQVPDCPVIADCGRYSAASVSPDRVRSASVVLALVQNDAASIERAKATFAPMLRQGSFTQVFALLVGEQPYPVESVRPLFRGVELLGALPWDRRAAFAVSQGGWGKRHSRTIWARTLADVTEAIEDVTAWVPEGMDTPEVVG